MTNEIGVNVFGKIFLHYNYTTFTKKNQGIFVKTIAFFEKMCYNLKMIVKIKFAERKLCGQIREKL